MAIIAGQTAALRNLCAILNVPFEATKPSPGVALSLLALVYGLPVVKSRERTRAAGNEILQATQPHFDKWSLFVGSIGRSIALMQTIPAFYNVLRLSSDQLVSRYKAVATTNRLIEMFGLVGGASAVGAGVGESIKKQSIGEGVKKFGGRMIGKGPVSEALVERYGKGAGAKRAGLAAIAAAATAKLVHESGKQQMAEIRAIMRHRFQAGQANNGQFAVVVNNAVDPGAIKRYWEYR